MVEDAADTFEQARKAEHALAVARERAGPSRLPQPARRPSNTDPVAASVTPGPAMMPRRSTRRNVSNPSPNGLYPSLDGFAAAPASATSSSTAAHDSGPSHLSRSVISPVGLAATLEHRQPKPIIFGADPEAYQRELRAAAKPASVTVPRSDQGPSMLSTPWLRGEPVEPDELPIPEPDSTMIMHDDPPIVPGNLAPSVFVDASVALSPAIREAAVLGSSPALAGPIRSQRSSRKARKTQEVLPLRVQTEADEDPSQPATPRASPRKKGKRKADVKEEDAALKPQADHDDDFILPASLTGTESAVKKRRKLASSRLIAAINEDLDSLDSGLPPPTPKAKNGAATAAKRIFAPSPVPLVAPDQSQSFTSSTSFLDFSYQPSANAAIPLPNDFLSPSKVPPPTGKRKLHNPDEPLPAPSLAFPAEDVGDAREKTLGSLRSLASDWQLKPEGKAPAAVGAARKRPRAGVSALNAGKKVSSASAAASSPKPVAARARTTSTRGATARGNSTGPVVGPATTKAAVPRATKKPAAATAKVQPTIDDLDLTKFLPDGDATVDASTADTTLGPAESTFVTNTDASGSSIGLGLPSRATNGSVGASLASRRAISGPNGVARPNGIPRPATTAATNGVGLGKARRVPSSAGLNTAANAPVRRSVSTSAGAGSSKVFPGGNVGIRKPSVAGKKDNQ